MSTTHVQNQTACSVLSQASLLLLAFELGCWKRLSGPGMPPGGRLLVLVHFWKSRLRRERAACTQAGAVGRSSEGGARTGDGEVRSEAASDRPRPRARWPRSAARPHDRNNDDPIERSLLHRLIDPGLALDLAPCPQWRRRPPTLSPWQLNHAASPTVVPVPVRGRGIRIGFGSTRSLARSMQQASARRRSAAQKACGESPGRPRLHAATYVSSASQSLDAMVGPDGLRNTRTPGCLRSAGRGSAQLPACRPRCAVALHCC